MPNLLGVCSIGRDLEVVRTRHKWSAGTGRVGGVVDPVEPSTRGRVIREGAVFEWGCAARSSNVPAKRNRITREWAPAQAEGAVVTQGGVDLKCRSVCSLGVDLGDGVGQMQKGRAWHWRVHLLRSGFGAAVEG